MVAEELSVSIYTAAYEAFGRLLGINVLEFEEKYIVGLIAPIFYIEGDGDVVNEQHQAVGIFGDIAQEGEGEFSFGAVSLTEGAYFDEVFQVYHISDVLQVLRESGFYGDRGDEFKVGIAEEAGGLVSHLLQQGDILTHLLSIFRILFVSEFPIYDDCLLPAEHESVGPADRAVREDDIVFSYYLPPGGEPVG